MTETEVTTDQESPYLAALKTPQLMSLSKKDARAEVGRILTRCLLDCSRVLDKTAFGDFVTAILEEVAVKFKNCTVGELEILMHNGIRLEYGEYFGLNAVTVHGWIKAFIRGPERVRAIGVVKGLVVGQVMSPEQAEAGWKEKTLERFEMFKKTGVLHEDFPTNLYNELSQRGLLHFDNVAKWEIYRAAETAVFERKKKIRETSMVRSERNEATGFMNRMSCNQLTQHEKFEVQQEARLMSIKRFYEGVEKLVL